MLAGQQRGFGVGVMQHVGRGQVDDVDVFIGQHGLKRAVRARDAEQRRFFHRLGVAVFRQPQHFVTVAAQPFDVRRADKTSAGHADANRFLAE